MIISCLLCFTCHKDSHKGIDCPERGNGNSSTTNRTVVKKEAHLRQVNVATPQKKKKNVIIGTVNGVETEILLDSVADYGVVPEEMIPNRPVARGSIGGFGF